MADLVSRLLGDDLEARGLAIQESAKSNDSAVIVALLRLLRNPETGEQPRHEIADVLGRSGHADAILALKTGTADSDEIYRGLCACGLGHVATAESVALLISLLSDKVNTVRNLAERSLLQMPEAVRDHGVEALLALLKHPVPLSRSPAARLLGLSKDHRALAPLLKLLTQDRQWLVRMWAAKGLGDLGAVEAFDALADRLKHDEKNRVRAASAEALGKLDHPQVEEALQNAVNDEDGGVRQHVEESLAKLRRARIGHDEPEEHHEPHFE